MNVIQSTDNLRHFFVNLSAPNKSAPSLQSKGRDNSVDFARIIAAFGVVFVHLAPSTPNAEVVSLLFHRFGVPFFFTISLFYLLRRALRAEEFRLTSFGWDRILIPYVVWSGVYFCLRSVKYQLVNQSAHWNWLGVALYGESGVQMYYLPLLLFFQALLVAFVLMGRQILGLTKGFLWLSLLLFAAAFLYVVLRENGVHLYLLRGMAFIVGASVLFTTQRIPLGRRFNRILGLIIIVTMAIWVLRGATYVGVTARVGDAVAGYGFAALALNISLPPAGRGWQVMLGSSYAIYLSHPLFLEAFEFAAPRFEFDLMPYNFVSKTIITLLTTACCVLLLAGVRKSPTLAYLLYGERPSAKPNQAAPSSS